MNIRSFFQKIRVRKLISKRMPNKGYFNRQNKISELLPKAMRLREEGYDFHVVYRKEERHFIWLKDKIARSEALYDGGQFSGHGGIMATEITMESGRGYTSHCYYDENGETIQTPNPYEGTDYKKWFVDKVEKIEIIKGGNLNV